MTPEEAKEYLEGIKNPKKVKTRNKTLRQRFFNATKLNNIWNKIIDFEGYKLATVMWHKNPWKIVKTDNFDDFSDSWACNRTGVVAEFHTQKELWEHIKTKDKI